MQLVTVYFRWYTDDFTDMTQEYLILHALYLYFLTLPDCVMSGAPDFTSIVKVYMFNSLCQSSKFMVCSGIVIWKWIGVLVFVTYLQLFFVVSYMPPLLTVFHIWCLIRPLLYIVRCPRKSNRSSPWIHLDVGTYWLEPHNIHLFL